MQFGPVFAQDVAEHLTKSPASPVLPRDQLKLKEEAAAAKKRPAEDGDDPEPFQLKVHKRTRKQEPKQFLVYALFEKSTKKQHCQLSEITNNEAMAIVQHAVKQLNGQKMTTEEAIAYINQAKTKKS